MKTKAPLPPLDEKQRYSIEETIAYLRSSRMTIYKLLAAGEIKSITLGRRRFIPGSEIARLSSVGPAPASIHAMRSPARGAARCVARAMRR